MLVMILITLKGYFLLKLSRSLLVNKGSPKRPAFSKILFSDGHFSLLLPLTRCRHTFFTSGSLIVENLRNLFQNKKTLKEELNRQKRQALPGREDESFFEISFYLLTYAATAKHIMIKFYNSKALKLGFLRERMI